MAFNAASFFFLDPETGKIKGAVLENIDSKFLTPILRMQNNLPIPLPIKGAAQRGSDLFSPSAYLALPLYEKVLRPNRLFFSLIGTTRSPQEECLGQYWLWRYEGQPNFSKHDLIFAEEISTILGGILCNHHEKNGPLQPMMDIVKQRSCPGVLIFDEKEKLVFLNQEARENLEIINQGLGKDQPHPANPLKHFLQICGHMKEHLDQKRQNGNDSLTVDHVYCFGGEKLSFRAMTLEKQKLQGKPYMLILIERISEDKLKINRMLDRLKLSPRETGVVKLILLGQTNKEIAQDLKIGEHTVKDHIRNVMSKLRVTTRTGIISRVLNLIYTPNGLDL